MERPVANQSQARRPRRTRVRRHATAARPDWQDAADELPDSPVTECPASPPPPSHLRPPTLTSLDDIDLLNELRHPVPTLQTVPFSSGLSGARAEHYKLLLGHADDMELLTEAANLLAQAQVPCEVAASVALTRMTAIRKPGGGVRGIATGDMFRRLVSRSLAAAWASVFDQATRPYQFALRTRAGVDALSARLRATLENDARATVVSLDGRSAYDCISRAAFLQQLCDVAPALVPFARLFYGQTSEYQWWDDDGVRHGIPQAEGCEQGDPLAPALFALGQHEALRRADAQLRQGESLVAFLDDL